MGTWGEGEEQGTWDVGMTVSRCECVSFEVCDLDKSFLLRDVFMGPRRRDIRGIRPSFVGRQSEEFEELAWGTM